MVGFAFPSSFFAHSESSSDSKIKFELIMVLPKHVQKMPSSEFNISFNGYFSIFQPRSLHSFFHHSHESTLYAKIIEKYVCSYSV